MGGQPSKRKPQPRPRRKIERIGTARDVVEKALANFEMECKTCADEYYEESLRTLKLECRREPGLEACNIDFSKYADRLRYQHAKDLFEVFMYSIKASLPEVVATGAYQQLVRYATKAQAGEYYNDEELKWLPIKHLGDWNKALSDVYEAYYDILDQEDKYQEDKYQESLRRV